MEVNVHEAKMHLSRLLESVERGQEVVIMRSNTPIARLVAIAAPARRELGWARGEFIVPEDFDAPLPPELQDAFYR